MGGLNVTIRTTTMLFLGVLLLGCPSAGTGGGGGVSSNTWDMRHLEFQYYGEQSDGGYNTDVELQTSESSDRDFVYVWLNDASDSIAIDSGTYTLQLFDTTPGTMADVVVWTGHDGTSYEFAASASATEAAFEAAFGPVDEYVIVDDGEVTVSRISEREYSLTWRLTSTSGKTISGQFTGEVGNLLSADAYEPDNTAQTAFAYVVGTHGLQNRNFHYPEDVDWVQFDVVSGESYTITTAASGSGECDTILLLDDDGDPDNGYLAFSDGVAGSLYAEIEYTAASPDTLFVQVTEYDEMLCEYAFEISTKN